MNKSSAWKFTEAMRKRMDREVNNWLKKKFPDLDVGEIGYAIDSETETSYIWSGEYKGSKFNARYEKSTRKIYCMLLNSNRFESNHLT